MNDRVDEPLRRRRELEPAIERGQVGAGDRLQPQLPDPRDDVAAHDALVGLGGQSGRTFACLAGSHSSIRNAASVSLAGAV